jgi:hypothetical protein
MTISKRIFSFSFSLTATVFLSMSLDRTNLGNRYVGA